LSQRQNRKQIKKKGWKKNKQIASHCFKQIKKTQGRQTTFNIKQEESTQKVD